MADTDRSLKVSDIVELRNYSRDWMNNNFWDELVEVFRGIMCRTAPIMRKNPETGKDEEDKSRTNVAMADLNIIWRRNTARMTANPYRLNFTGGDELIAEMLSGVARKQYDRSDEAYHDTRVVMGAEAFGFAYSKLYWDTLEPTRRYRQALVNPVTGKVMLRDRRSIMRGTGAPEDEVSDAVSQLGQEMSDQEVAQYTMRKLNEIVVEQKVKKYEGPCVKSVFPGDIFFEPGVMRSDDSDYTIEQYTETDLWLQKMVKLTYTDPETGKEMQAFDSNMCQKLIDADPGAQEPDQRINDLKQMMRNVLGTSPPRIEKRLLSRKRFDILEYHAQGEDGRMWIEFVSEKVNEGPLGRMPYPYDLYGKSAYTELVPLPNLITAQGDSTPRLLRYQYYLHNFATGQNFDYIDNLLKPFVLKDEHCEIRGEVVRRGQFRELTVSKIGGVEVLQTPPLPPGAFERIAQIRSEMAVAEPSVNDIESGGTAANPQAGRLATTAVLASKREDVLLQYKINGRDRYLKDLGLKKLWMNQQMAQEPFEVDQKYWGQPLNEAVEGGQLQEWAMQRAGGDMQPEEMAQFADKVTEQWMLSSRDGKTVAVRLDPMEMQEDYDVEPEAGSYMAVDDEMRQQSFQRMATIAAGAPPGIVDWRKVVEFGFSTIRDIGDTKEFLLPEPTGPPPPQVKGNLNVTLPMDKVDKIPHDIVNQLLPLIGLQPSKELEQQATLDGVSRIADAANAAADLTSEAHPPEPVGSEPGKKPNGTSPTRAQ